MAAGDFNSSAADGATATCLLLPEFVALGECPTPYAVMSAYGFSDTWSLRNGAGVPGYTCCQQNLLMNPLSWLDERIDLVWVRPPLGGPQGPHFLNAVHATVVGDRPEDKSVDELWPSEHAGVGAGMTFRVKR